MVECCGRVERDQEAAMSIPKEKKARLRELERLELVMLKGIDAAYYIVEKARACLERIRTERQGLRA